MSGGEKPLKYCKNAWEKDSCKGCGINGLFSCPLSRLSVKQFITKCSNIPEKQPHSKPSDWGAAALMPPQGGARMTDPASSITIPSLNDAEALHKTADLRNKITAELDTWNLRGQLLIIREAHLSTNPQAERRWEPVRTPVVQKEVDHRVLGTVQDQ